jgi:hypothetical protein
VMTSSRLVSCGTMALADAGAGMQTVEEDELSGTRG